jgi:hypothetical protein
MLQGLIPEAHSIQANSPMCIGMQEQLRFVPGYCWIWCGPEFPGLVVSRRRPTIVYHLHRPPPTESDPLLRRGQVDSIVIGVGSEAHLGRSLQSFRPPYGHEPTKDCHCWRRSFLVLRCFPSPLPCTSGEHSATSGTRLRPTVVTLWTRSIRCRS